MDALEPTLEAMFWANGARYIAGVDEVGRGPLAGPVVAAAVVLDRAQIPEGLNDSKKLNPKRREALDRAVRETAVFTIAEASVQEIDRINILHASMLAMRRAVEALPFVPDHVLVDGNHLPPDLPCDATPIVGGDGKSPSIAAASIVAKTWRDKVMRDLAQHFPGYGWETNAGYPSKSHRLALRDLGVTPHHRRSFKPVHNILYQDKNLTI